MKASPNWFSGHCKISRLAIIGADHRIFVCASPKENSIIDPLRLNELKLPPDMGSNEGEHESAISSIIFERSIGKQWAIRSSTPNHSMNSRNAGYGCVARIAATDV